MLSLHHLWLDRPVWDISGRLHFPAGMCQCCSRFGVQCVGVGRALRERWMMLHILCTAPRLQLSDCARRHAWRIPRDFPRRSCIVSTGSGSFRRRRRVAWTVHSRNWSCTGSPKSTSNRSGFSFLRALTMQHCSQSHAAERRPCSNRSISPAHRADSSKPAADRG